MFAADASASRCLCSFWSVVLTGGAWGQARSCGEIEWVIVVKCLLRGTVVIYNIWPSVCYQKEWVELISSWCCFVGYCGLKYGLPVEMRVLRW